MANYMFIKKYIYILIISGFINGCKLKKDGTYSIKHLFGDTSYVRNQELKDCKSVAQDMNNDSRKIMKSYVEKIVTFITEKNLNTFKGFLDRKNLCVAIILTPNINASALAYNGLIIVNANSFSVVESDAMMAGIIAHELAHISLNHTENKYLEKVFSSKLTSSEINELQKAEDEYSSSLNNFFLIGQKMELLLPQNTQYPAQENSSNSKVTFINNGVNYILNNQICKPNCQKYRELANDAIKYATDLENLKIKQQNIIGNKFSSEEIANKVESDATQIGLEFLARADINPEAFWKFNIIMNQKYKNKSSCDGSYSRGVLSHPDRCWEVQDILNELKIHEKDYNMFFNKKLESFILDPDLSMAKLESKKSMQSLEILGVKIE